MVPVRVETYTDEKGMTIAGRVEHPSAVTIERIMRLDPVSVLPDMCGNFSVFVVRLVGGGYRVSIRKELKYVKHVEAHEADLIVTFTDGVIKVFKDRLGDHSVVLDHVDKAWELIENRVKELKALGF